MATTAPIILPIKTPGLSQLQKMERRMKALEDTVERLNKDLLKNAAATKASGRAAATATGNIQRMGIAFRTTLGPIVATYAAINFLNKSLQVASERQVNIAKLTNGLQNLGATAADFENLVVAADKFGRSTLFDQEDATQAFALLTSFQRIGVDSYERVTKAASDLATVTGQDLKGAMTQLSKALEDPAKRVTDLARSGTVFTDQQKAQIKTLQESGRLFEAQDLILKEIEKQYGGAAEAAGSAGLAGALDTLGEATRDFQEELVTGTGTINLAETAILQLAGAIDVATGKLKEVQLILSFLDGLLQNATGSVNGLAGAWDFLTESVINSVPAVRDAIRAYEFLLKVAGKYNDQKAGRRNFGSNYASQEEALFKAAGGYLPPKPQPTPDPTPVTATKASGSKGVDKAARELERQRKELERQFEAGENIKRNLENQMMLLSAATDLEKDRLRVVIDLDDTIRRIKETAAPDQQEGLIVSATELARLEDMKLIIESFAKDVGAWDFIPEVNKELTQTEELLKGAYDIVANSLTSSIEGLIDGTKEWSDVLSDVLGQLGQMFLKAGFNGLGTGLFGFAEGGRPPTDQPSIVGERGPELFVPDSPGTVLSNQDSKAALSSYTRMSPEQQKAADKGEVEGGSNPAVPMSFSFNTVKIADEDYVSREQLEQAMQVASSQGAKEGAKIGEAQMLRRLRMNPATRRQVGL